MITAAFFGHREFDYSQYKDVIFNICEYTIRDLGVDLFYNGFRGDFDHLCANVVCGLKKKYLGIKQLMVLSYRPDRDFRLPTYFDESIYLLENKCPPQYAIAHTNREIIKKCDIVISGVKYDFGGAWTACEYARRIGRRIISIFDR